MAPKKSKTNLNDPAGLTEEQQAGLALSQRLQAVAKDQGVTLQLSSTQASLINCLHAGAGSPLEHLTNFAPQVLASSRRVVSKELPTPKRKPDSWQTTDKLNLPLTLLPILYSPA